MTTPIATLRTSEPVATNGTIAAFVAALVPVLAYLGVQSDEAGRVGSFVGVALALILAGWHIWSARSKVLPVKGNAAAELLADAREVLELLQQLPTTPAASFVQWSPGVATTLTTVAPIAATALAPSVTGGVVEHDDGTLAPPADDGAASEPVG